MKNKLLISAFLVLFLALCKPAKVVYVFPEGMTDAVRVSTEESCEKGRIMFGVHCAACHVKKEGKKEIFPSFSAEQLSNYEFRFLNRNHEDSLTEDRLSQDDLVHIMNFLTYRKKDEPVK